MLPPLVLPPLVLTEIRPLFEESNTRGETRKNCDELMRRLLFKVSEIQQRSWSMEILIQSLRLIRGLGKSMVAMLIAAMAFCGQGANVC